MARKAPLSTTEYLDTLPEDRRETVATIMQTIRDNMDPALEEGVQYKMPAFFLPHSAYPNGYHCDPKQPLPFASVASQKNSVSIYLFCTYCDPAEKDRLEKEWKATGNRWDAGKSCIRVKKLEQVPLDVLGAAVKRMTAKKFVVAYEAAIPVAKRKPAKKK